MMDLALKEHSMQGFIIPCCMFYNIQSTIKILRTETPLPALSLQCLSLYFCVHSSGLTATRLITSALFSIRQGESDYHLQNLIDLNAPGFTETHDPVAYTHTSIDT